MFKNKILAFIVIIGFMFLCPGCGQAARPERQAPSEAIDFEFVDPDGNHVKLSDYSGKPIVLIFFHTSCDACKAEIPELNDFYAAHSEVALFAVMLNARSSEDLRWAKEKFYIEYPLIADDGVTSRLYEPIRYVPFTVIIDRDFNIVYRQSAAETRRSLEDKIGTFVK